MSPNPSVSTSPFACHADSPHRPRLTRPSAHAHRFTSGRIDFSSTLVPDSPNKLRNSIFAMQPLSQLSPRSKRTPLGTNAVSDVGVRDVTNPALATVTSSRTSPTREQSPQHLPQEFRQDSVGIFVLRTVSFTDRHPLVEAQYFQQRSPLDWRWAGESSRIVRGEVSAGKLEIRLPRTWNSIRDLLESTDRDTHSTPSLFIHTSLSLVPSLRSLVDI